MLGNVSAIAYGSGGVSEPGIKLYDSDIYNAKTIILNTINFLMKSSYLNICVIQIMSLR